MTPSAVDIAIIDYGMGNLHSVAKALEKVAGGKAVSVTSDPAVVARAGRVIFPGQGAMPDCMHELARRGLTQAVLEAAVNKPFMGLCIGQQMLFEHSDEGNVPGLGILPGNVVRFPMPSEMQQADGTYLKVPHMGWNTVYQQAGHPMWQEIENGARFYFVHSYYVVPKVQQLAAATTDYGVNFTSAVSRDNIFTVQFHPEKSAAAGLTLLRNFVHWKP